MALLALQSVIAALDLGSNFSALSYPLTKNQQLGYDANNPSSAFKFIPYGEWANYDKPLDPLPSVLEQSFRDTVVIGHTNADGTVDKSHSFIDILHLETPSTLFFTEKLLTGPDAGKTLIQSIVDTVDSMDLSILPVIRFLVGNPTPPGIVCPQNFTDIFWPDGKPIFTHPNAMLYVGTFNPNASLENDLTSDIESWADAIIDYPEQKLIEWGNEAGSYFDWPTFGTDEVGPFYNKYIVGVLNEANGSIIKSTFSNIDTPLSWNHAKIVAVNGKALLTGGGNYYDLYTSQLGGSLIDNDITILGDAARTAHNYADYLWTYLNSNHSLSDTASQAWAALLSGPAPSSGIPLLRGEAPLFPQSTPSLKGDVSVLTTGKVGNFDPITNLTYPSQILDAVRDVLWNILWEKAVINPVVDGIDLGTYNLLPLIAEYTSDSEMLSALTDLGVSPASWASRIARVNAVANASQYVYMAQQMLVNWDMVSNPHWSKAVDTINNDLNINWDGMVWPYDLLMSFARALTTFQTNPNPPVPDNMGIYIVLSNRDWADASGYNDNTTITALTQRLVDVMSNMTVTGLLDDSNGNMPFDPLDVPNIVANRFHVKRSDLKSASGTGQYNEKKLHAKVVDVDGQLLYTGSDNAYPQWNEQFGVWIDDQKSIAAWEGLFWDGLWERALEVD